MENRKAAPAQEERPKKAGYDDFDPPENSGGPVIEENPTGAYDIDAAPSLPPADAAEK